MGYQPSSKANYEAIEWPIGRSGVVQSQRDQETEVREAYLWFYKRWGYTAQQAADALAQAFGDNNKSVAIAPEPIGNSSDGISPCGYEEL